MTVFQPTAFVGRPLPELLVALERLGPTARPLLRCGELRLHHANRGPAGVADSPVPVDHPEVTIPGVVLEGYLGGGGQGHVYAGRVTATGKVVAVKLLAGGPGRGVREAILAARVRHPNVRRVLRAQAAGPAWVVVMEMVVGAELSPADPPADARGCFARLADGLTAVAGARLVHRDVKPANVLLRDADGSPVLVDFGLAVDLHEPGDDDPDVSGTPVFLPPEAWRDARPDPSWDAYALGVTVAVTLGRRHGLFDETSSLRRSKLTGEFDAVLRQALDAIDDHALCGWARQLTDPSPAARLTALRDAATRLAA